MDRTDWAKFIEEQERLSIEERHQEARHLGNISESSIENDEIPDEVDMAEASLLEKMTRKRLNETEHDSVKLQKYSNLEIFSAKTFASLALHPNLLKGIYAMGYNTPSKIQATTLPCLLTYPPKNLIAQSQSGTGKTAAFIMAILSKVDVTKNYTQIICLSPTYELAIQTGEVAAAMSKFLPEITLRFAVRGEELPRNTKLTEHIILGTPGKTLDWGLKYKLFDLKKISVLVLDEADIMMSTQGHRSQCIRIHKQLRPDCQMMFFSATFNDDVIEFTEVISPNAIIARLERKDECLDNIHQYYMQCENPEKKYAALINVYSVLSIGQCIIFCQTRFRAGWLADTMSADGHSVAVLSGALTVEQRLNILDHFRQGRYKVLITTNVLSRGIDIEKVTIVVNFDLPVDARGKIDYETYLHRVGRAGRFGKYGIAINLIDSLKSWKIMQQIEAHFFVEIKCLDIDELEQLENL